jgi:hypothetical protein
MTWWRTILLLSSLAAEVGCSPLLAGAGRHQSALRDDTPRARVVAELGPADYVCPMAGNFRDDCWNELYATFGKYPDTSDAFVLAIADTLTLGFVEAITSPVLLGESAVRAVTPGGLAVTYCVFRDRSGSAESPRPAAAPVVRDTQTSFTSDVGKLAEEACTPSETLERIF